MALMCCGRAALVSRCQRGQSPWAEGVNTNWATLGNLRRLMSSWARVMISSLSSSVKHDATRPLCANARILDRKSDALNRQTVIYVQKAFLLLYFPYYSITINHSLKHHVKPNRQVFKNVPFPSPYLKSSSKTEFCSYLCSLGSF